MTEKKTQNKKSNNKIIIANWKMKLKHKESIDLAKKFKEKFKNFNKGEVVFCPNFVSLTGVKRAVAGSKIKLGAQDVFWESQGSFTGEIQPEVLSEVGCKYAIIGHSERRKYLLENYTMIHQKVKAVLDSGKMTPVVCIGEEMEDRKSDKRDFVLVHQLQQALGGIKIMNNQEIIIAYEPVWAIGSGTPIEPKEAKYAHKIIRLALNDMFGMSMVEKNFRIVYGGSVNKENVAKFSGLNNLDGLLVGGASLEVNNFYTVAKNIL